MPTGTATETAMQRALAGGAVAGADQRVDRLVHVRVGHDDHVVLGAAEGLHALIVLAAFLVDVLGDRRGADEADRVDVRMMEQGVDGLLVAVDDVPHAVRHTGLLPHLGQHVGGRGVALGGLVDEGVAAGDRRREHPHRDHGREVERRDAGHDAHRLADRGQVDAAADVRVELALHQVRRAGGELEHVDAALDLALGVRQRLAVLAAQGLRQFLAPGDHQLAHLEDHRGALRHGGGAPLSGGRLRVLDSLADLVRGRIGQLADHLARRRIEDVAEAPALPRDRLAADEVAVCLGHDGWLLYFR